MFYAEANRDVFVKPKTAYEVGLGIPAEPLFRSDYFRDIDPRQQEPYDQYHENSHAKHWDYHKTRSEERFSRNAETDLVCRLLLEKKKERMKLSERQAPYRRLNYMLMIMEEYEYMQNTHQNASN